MKSLLVWAAIGAAFYYFTHSNSAGGVPGAGGLPAGATQVKTVSALGQQINVYLADNGYYFTYGSKVYGPYSQAEVATALQAQTTLTGIFG